MIYQYLNEAVAVLHDGIVSNEEQLDAGMIFGTGFAPFRGGPLHYIRTFGANKIVTRLKEFESRYGSRFKAHTGWNAFVTASDEEE